ncbi:MAG TPA: dienelactone hydrolase family protein [Phototrophicaceae bacterium]|nr:dienelactone hydrolase family protein [Phototrophicaceae bacterium]
MQTQMVDFDAAGVMTPGYLARPDGNAPGVVVIQEWWGLDNHIKGIADRFAQAGFVAIAPDLYHGQVTHEPDEAKKLAMELQYPEAMKDMQGAVDYLLAQPFVSPKKVGIIGFCMGGRLSGMMAYNGHNLSAAVPFYGMTALSDEDAAKVSVPVLAIYGGQDKGFPPELREGNDQKLTAAGKPHEVVVYPDAPHAFFNDTRPHIYDQTAATDAWKRATDWFKRYLK